MFTGLVEALGSVQGIGPDPGGGIRLQVRVPESWTPEREVGESVAINGCCLTVIDVQGDLWSFQAGDETLSKTNLGVLTTGVRVNLERSLPANGRLGGHFVQGHVDGTGSVVAKDISGEWVMMWFSAPQPLLNQMVTKGSIAVDGVSLTVVSIGTDRFSVALIPHTLAVTTLGIRGVGDKVNLETDILGKYVEKMLRVDGRS